VTLRLRDTLTRSVRLVEPLEPGRVTMYTCGPTVYRYAHVGNLRTFLLADLIRRTLLYHGLDVVHVQNITDVGHLRDERLEAGEDRMLAAAGLEGRPAAEIANAYEASFHEDAAGLNLLPAHVFPRATEHIPEMINLAERLEDLGHAYATREGNVYYAVATFPGYGALSGNALEDLRAGHRGEVEGDKRDPADFALWKAAEPGRLLTWPAHRWGIGFPGWHLECSAMALRHLGPHFDIHTGGEDNVFPHHEDEIAQSAPLVGGPPASLWVHGAHLLMRGRKMAKSAGNFQRITEIEAAGIEPLAFRYLCLTARYGRKINYTDRSLGAAAGALASLQSAIRALGPPPATGPWAAPPALRAGVAPARPAGRVSEPAGHGARAGEPPFEITDRAGAPGASRAPLSSVGRTLHERFVAAIDDDLDLPTALRTARAVLRSPLEPDEQRWLLLDMDLVLGLDVDRAWDAERAAVAPALPMGAAALLEARTRARRERDWPAADALRERLRAFGIEPIDNADGFSDWRRIERDVPG
jgi:cysteinyl-tRNA synthetase